MFFAIVFVCLATQPEDCSPDVVHRFTYGQSYTTVSACMDELPQHEAAVSALVSEHFPDLKFLVRSDCVPDGNSA